MSPIKQDGPYDSRTLTKWFFGSSAALTLVSVWMVLDDYSRPWKLTQERFRDIEVARARAELQDAERRQQQDATLGPLEAAVEAARAEVAKQSAAIKEAKKHFDTAQAHLEAARLRYAGTKSKLESAVYYLEHYRELGLAPKAKEYEAEVARLEEQLKKDGLEQEAFTIEVNVAKAEIDNLEKAETTARKAVEKAHDAVGRARKKLEAIDPTETLNPIVRVRDKPFVDFLDPTIKPRQYVLDGIKDDIYFAKVRKVDRCQTCHLAIDRKQFTGAVVAIQNVGLVSVQKAEPKGADWQLTFEDGHQEVVPTAKLEQIKGHENPMRIGQPFLAHPRLDLFLSSSSPHPAEKFGCTVCHLGEGPSIGFTTASHIPQDEKQREKWREEHHWNVREHWAEPMFAGRYAEASCLLCHANNRPVPGADKLNFGREVWERVSCVGCHKMKGFDDEAKKGPDLRKLASKLTPEFVSYWIEDPARFRPKTNMPRLFGVNLLSNDERGELKLKGVDVDARESVEIRSIVEWLFAQSDEWKPAELKGDKPNAANGEVLFTSRGCVGCHRVEPTDAEAKAHRTYAPDEFGPNLYNTGWKTTAKWVASWAKDPKHYWGETRMPNLRLSDQDALDLAAYLTDGPNVKDKERPAGMPDKLGPLTVDQKKELDALVVEYLEKDYTKPERDAILSGRPLGEKGKALPDERSRLLYLGEQAVNRSGCFGCHYVKGMETRPGIGRELTNIADKPLTQVDWGFEAITREAHERPNGKIRETLDEWLHLKVMEPRTFDRGKVKAWLDRTRMPRFNLEPHEREALVTYLLGHTDIRQVSEEYRYKPSVRKAALQDGDYAIQRANCKACHLFAVDKIALTDPKGAPVTDEAKTAKGETIRSPITGEIVKLPMSFEGLALLDTLNIAGADGKPAYGEDGRAILAVFGDSKTIDKHPGDYVIAGDGTDFKNYTATSPRIGGEADIAKVLAQMPDVSWALRPSGEVDPKELAGRKAAVLAAVARGDGARHRGGTNVQKIIRQKFMKDNKLDAWSPEGKKDWDPSEISKYLASVEQGKTDSPPHLIGEGNKVQSLWLQSFMRQPVELRPWLEVRMPTFGFTDPQAQVYARHFASQDEERRIALAMPVLAKLAAKARLKEGEKGYEPGYRTRTELQDKVYPALDALGAREYFALTILDGVLNYAPRPDVSLSRPIEEKTDLYQTEREQKNPGWYGSAHRLFADGDVNCQKCHLVHGQEPIGATSTADKSSWAPDLGRVRDRLRPEFIRAWVENPKNVVPGTKMPQLLFDGKKQELLAGPATKQIDAIVDWLMAGAPATLDVGPTPAKAGQPLRATSALLALAAPSIEVKVVIDGKELAVKDVVREKSGERTTALRFNVPAEAAGKKVVVKVKDGRFTASADVKVD